MQKNLDNIGLQSDEDEDEDDNNDGHEEEDREEQNLPFYIISYTSTFSKAWLICRSLMSFFSIISVPCMFVFEHMYDDFKKAELALDILWFCEIYIRCTTTTPMYTDLKGIVKNYLIVGTLISDLISTLPCLFTGENIYALQFLKLFRLSHFFDIFYPLKICIDRMF